MHETARELSAQLDAKLGLLQSLIAEAGRAAERLEDALDRGHPTLPPGSQAESLRPATHARNAQEEESPPLISPGAKAEIPEYVEPSRASIAVAVARRFIAWPITASPRRRSPIASAFRWAR